MIFLAKWKNRLLKIAVALSALMCLMFGMTAMAYVADSQLDHSYSYTVQDTQSYGVQRFKIGSFADGTQVTSYSFYGDFHNLNDGVTTLQIYATRCDDNSYSVNCITIENSSPTPINGFGISAQSYTVSFPTPFSLDSSHSWRFAIVNNAGNGTPTVNGTLTNPDPTYTDCVLCSAAGSLYYAISVTLPDTSTRIISTVPSNNQTISTSTAAVLGASVNINPDDFNTDEYVEISFYRNQDLQASISSPDLIKTVLRFANATSSGNINVSTTTSILREGTYTMSVSLKQTSLAGNILSFFGFGFVGSNNILATTTQFIVVAPTAYDNFVSSTTEALNNFVASSTLDIGVCTTFLSFNFVDCMSLLFTWQTAPMNIELNHLNQTLFAYAPWGYVTRTMNILTSNASTSIPAISYTFPDDFPAPLIAGLNIHFDPWNYFNFYENFTSSGTEHKNVWQIIEPLFTAFCWLWTIWLIFRDMLKIEHGSAGGRKGNARDA